MKIAPSRLKYSVNTRLFRNGSVLVQDQSSKVIRIRYVSVCMYGS